MVSRIGGICWICGNNNYIDPEYLKIIQELRRLGLTPTGNKQADKAKLEAEKSKLTQKVINKAQEQQAVNNNQDIASPEKRNQMEVQKVGAMTVAKLYKFLHGLS